MKCAPDDVRSLIRLVRGSRVIMDTDLASLYGVPTFRFNEAFKRNRHRFPPDFAFRLTAVEFAALRGLSSATRLRRGRTGTTNSSQFAMSSRKHRGSVYRPWAFTEHGALMASNVLRSPRASQMSVFVIRAFVKMREDLATNAAILKRLAEIDRTLLTHDSALRDIYRRLRPLLAPPCELAPAREIGFHTSLRRPSPRTRVGATATVPRLRYRRALATLAIGD